MNNEDVLVLHRRIRTPDRTSLHCRELELRLDADGRHLVLSRYTELYCEDQSIWGATHDHKVPLVSLLRWMISQERSLDITMEDKQSVIHPAPDRSHALP